MKFIVQIANQYHYLMGAKTEYMEGQISAISGWSQSL